MGKWEKLPGALGGLWRGQGKHGFAWLLGLGQLLCPAPGLCLQALSMGPLLEEMEPSVSWLLASPSSPWIASVVCCRPVHIWNGARAGCMPAQGSDASPLGRSGAAVGTEPCIPAPLPLTTGARCYQRRACLSAAGLQGPTAWGRQAADPQVSGSSSLKICELPSRAGQNVLQEIRGLGTGPCPDRGGKEGGTWETFLNEISQPLSSQRCQTDSAVP